MGLGGISIWQLLIILLIIVLLFGTKKLKGLGSDLGGALKGFKNALNDEDNKGEANSKEGPGSEQNASPDMKKESDDKP